MLFHVILQVTPLRPRGLKSRITSHELTTTEQTFQENQWDIPTSRPEASYRYKTEEAFKYMLITVLIATLNKDMIHGLLMLVVPAGKEGKNGPSGGILGGIYIQARDDVAQQDLRARLLQLYVRLVCFECSIWRSASNGHSSPPLVAELIAMLSLTLQVDMADALAPVEVRLSDGLVVEGKFFTQATDGTHYRLALKDVSVRGLKSRCSGL